MTAPFLLLMMMMMMAILGSKEASAFVVAPTPRTTMRTTLLPQAPRIFAPCPPTSTSTTTRFLLPSTQPTNGRPPFSSTSLKQSTTTQDAEEISFSDDPLPLIGSLWGTGGVLYALIVAFQYAFQHAMEPIRMGRTFFSPLQWCAYAITVLTFAYGQGEKCGGKKLAPLVVKRSVAMTTTTGAKKNLLKRVVLAPLYVSGLIDATKQRKIKSYSLILGTAAFQVVLQNRILLPTNGPLWYILNAGFAAGFAWGATTLVWQYCFAFWKGQLPSVDDGVPTPSN